LTENFAPGALNQLGLSYEEVKPQDHLCICVGLRQLRALFQPAMHRSGRASHGRIDEPDGLCRPFSAQNGPRHR
jgi:hypothetical protein